MCIFCVLKIIGLTSGMAFLPVSVLAASRPAVDADQMKFPQMYEGEMFTIKLVPKAGRAEVYIMGKESALVEATEAGLTAQVTIGTKTWTYTPQRNGGFFEIVAPKEAERVQTYDLKLKVDRKGHKEEFDIPSVPSRP